MLIPDDSPIRNPPPSLSRRQFLLLDGIRFAAEMTDFGYRRLLTRVIEIGSRFMERVTTEDMASALLDTWSIVDSVHRLRSLLEAMPGLRHDAWYELFMRRTRDARDLRNSVQHQKGEIETLVQSHGQIWGYLSWADSRDGRHVGGWIIISPGSVYKGDRHKAGPATPAGHPPFGHLALIAYGRKVYLGSLVRAVREAVADLASEIEAGHVRPVGNPVGDARLHADWVAKVGLLAAYSVDPSCYSDASAE